MSINSMTGFARSEGLALSGTLSWAWELRSVNGKGLDVRLRLPAGLEALEAKAKKAVAARFARGNVSINLAIANTNASSGFQINEQFLDELIALAKRKADEHSGSVAPARLDGLIAAKGVVEAADLEPKSDEDRQARTQALLTGLDEALDALAEARASEGAHLSELLSSQLDQMEELSAKAASSAAAQPDALKVRLKTQVEKLIDASASLSEDRLVQEAALLATKADVREELDRLAAHIAQGRTLMTKGEPCGRRLEFLSQELNREVNTLCSKSSDADLTSIGLELKAVIDQFREQIQNVE